MMKRRLTASLGAQLCDWVTPPVAPEPVSYIKSPDVSRLDSARRLNSCRGDSNKFLNSMLIGQNQSASFFNREEAGPPGQ